MDSNPKYQQQVIIHVPTEWSLFLVYVITIFGCEREARRANLTHIILVSTAYVGPSRSQRIVPLPVHMLRMCLSSTQLGIWIRMLPESTSGINSGRFIGVLPIGDLFGSTTVPGINHYKKTSNQESLFNNVLLLSSWANLHVCRFYPEARWILSGLVSYIPIFLEQICHCLLFACDQHFSFLLLLSAC